MCGPAAPKKNFFFRSMDRSINRSITEIIYNGNLPSHWGLVPCLNPPFCLFKTDLSKKKNCGHLKFLLRFLRVFSDFRDLFWSSRKSALKISPENFRNFWGLVPSTAIFSKLRIVIQKKKLWPFKVFAEVLQGVLGFSRSILVFSQKWLENIRQNAHQNLCIGLEALCIIGPYYGIILLSIEI